MKVSVDELVDRVKANMEELTDSFDADIVMTAGIPALPRRRTPCRRTLCRTAVSSLPLTDCASLLRPQRSSDGSGYVLLPDDVWRMAEFCMDGWRQPVTEFIDKTSPEYELQFNFYTRGGCSTPVCVLSNEEGQKRIDYYSLPAHVVSHRVRSARYAAYPARDAESYELLPSLIPVVCYTCAALVYEILGRPEQAAAMMRCIVR